MEVGESSLKRLIEGEKQFLVPLYQRSYSWKPANHRQLWDDVLEQYGAVAESGSNGALVPHHFIGSVVLAPSPAIHAHGLSTFLVVDGQQRLTTLSIALAAVRDRAATKDAGVIRRFNQRYLLNEFESGTDRFRLLPTQDDRRSYAQVLEGKGSSADGLVGAAYAWWSARLSGGGPDGEPLDLERVEMILRDRLVMVAITTGFGDNPHRIFESLNDRGVGLSQADLLRNYIFMLLPTSAERVYEDIWLPMQRALGEQHLESLIQVDLVLSGQPDAKRNDLYSGMQVRLRPIEADEAALAEQLTALAARAQVLRRAIDPTTESNPAIRDALIRINRWGSTTPRPSVVWLLEEAEHRDAPSTQVVAALRLIESFQVRRLLVAKSTHNLNRIFATLPAQADASLPLDEAVRLVLSRERAFFPTDAQTRAAILTQPFYYQGRAEQQHHIFRCLEESYGHAEPIDWDLTCLTIEHVMPQTLTDDWRSALAHDGEEPDDIHAELLHTLGNLTLTAYNGTLSNHPFQRKQEILKGSHLELNQAIAPELTWTAEQIRARAADLAERAIRIWPGPAEGARGADAVGRDWSRLHQALALLPPGSWTTYRELAALIASHPVPVGQHLATNSAVVNAHRVLAVGGRPSPDFRWIDEADDRDLPSVLRGEGVHIDDRGVADLAQFVDAAGLEELIQIAEGAHPTLGEDAP
jgi:alkylated DNA nucleotide flippase Atl1